jgi:hypothetical protein
MLLAPLLAALCLQACGPAAPPPDSPPPPPSAAATTVAVPDVAPEPGVVRCGVDDQPRRVGELSPFENPFRDTTLADRAFLGEAVAPPPQGARPRPMMPRRLPPEPPLLPEPPGRIVAVQQGTARLGAASLPGTVALVGPASPDVCESLAEIPDSGPLLLEVELASSAAPLRVRSNRDRQSPYVRCLMERACRLRAPSEAASQRVTLPLVLRVEDPPPPPPPPPPRPTSRIEVHPVKGKEGDPIHARAAETTTIIGRNCLASQPLISGTLRIRLEMEQVSGFSRPNRRFFGAPPPSPMIPPSRLLRVARVVTEGKMEPEVSGLMACMAGQLSSQFISLDGLSQSNATKTSARVEVRVTAP